MSDALTIAAWTAEMVFAPVAPPLRLSVEFEWWWDRTGGLRSALVEVLPAGEVWDG